MLRKEGIKVAIAALAVALFAGVPARGDTMAPNSIIKDDGTITVPTFELPPSIYSSPEYQDYVVRQLRTPASKISGIEAQRQAVDARFYAPKVERLARLYPYTSTK